VFLAHSARIHCGRTQHSWPRWSSANFCCWVCWR
jgi:hypothetical protein